MSHVKHQKRLNWKKFIKRIFGPRKNEYKEEIMSAGVEEDLLTRTSWVDAGVAYNKVKKGKANGNTCALYIRWKLQTQLYNLGCFIQRHPGKVLFLGLLLLSLCCIGLKTAHLETELDKLWVEDGGRLQTELAYTKQHLGEGHGTTHEVVIQTPKAGGSILNTESMLLHLKVLKEATDVVVDVHNIQWKFKDICYLSYFPEFDDLVMDRILNKLMPCVIITPLDCFWEGSKLLQAQAYWSGHNGKIDWTNLNPRLLLDNMKKMTEPHNTDNHGLQIMQDIMDRAGVTTGYQEKPCLNPYDEHCPATAPNFQHKKKANIGSELTGGCSGFATKYMHWEEDLIVGGIHKNKSGHITRADALQSVVQLMGEKQMFEHYETEGLKVSSISWSQEKAKEVLTAWQHEFNKAVNRVINGSSSDFVWPFTSTSLLDLLKEFSQVSTVRVALGYVLMLIYACITLMKWSDAVQSQSGIGIAGVLLVTLGVAAGLGICSVLGIKFNASTTQILPFLALGLGVDDMFLLAHTFSQNANKQNIGHMEQTGEALKRTGVSVLLTSISITCAFFTAAIIPIPALRSFCLQAAILVLFNLGTILLVFPAVVSLDILRQQDHRVDVFCCFIGSTSDRVVEVSPRYGVSPTDCRARTPPPPYNNNFLNTPGAPHVHQSVTQVQPQTGITETILVPETRNTGQESACPSTTSSQQCLTPEEGLSCQDYCLKAPKACSHFSLNHFAATVYAPKLEKTPVKVLVIVCFSLLLAFGIFGTVRVQDGLELTDIVPKQTNEYNFLKEQSKYFGFYNMFAITQGDFDYPRNQRLLYKYHQSFQKVKHIIKRDDGTLPDFWLDLFRKWLLNLQEAFDRDVKAGYIFRQTNGRKPTWNQSVSDDGIFAFKLLAQTGDHSSPINANQVFNRRLVDSEGIINPAGFYNYLAAWVSNDEMAYASSQANLQPEPPHTWKHEPHEWDLYVPKAKPLAFAQLPFYLHQLGNTKNITAVVKQIRDICDSFSEQGLPSYPSGMPFTYWEQYLHLRYYLGLALLCVLITVFIILTLVLMNPWASAVVVVVLAMMLVELFGFMGLIGLKLSAVPAVILIVSVGIGVEFTVHICLGFITSIGSRNQRAQMALRHFMAPVIHGAVSTLLGVIMLAGSEFDFIVRYFFAVLTALVIIGVANGLILLPVLLSLVGPKAEVIPLDGSDHLQPPTPRSSPERLRRRSYPLQHPLQHPLQQSQAPQRSSRRPIRRVPSEISLSTISEEPTQYSSHEIIVQPEVVVETTLPGSTVVHSSNSSSSDSSRNPSPVPTCESSASTSSGHVTTRVTATAKVKVELHSPLPAGAVSEEHRYKSKRRKMKEIEGATDSDSKS